VETKCGNCKAHALRNDDGLYYLNWVQDDTIDVKTNHIYIL